MKQTTSIKALTLVMLMALCPVADASKCELTRERASDRDSSRCNCCFDDEINFNAQSMHRIAPVDRVDQSLFTPDSQCIFPPLDTLVPGWNLNFEVARARQPLPFNPIAMEFEVPKDFCNKKNVEVDLHLFAQRDVVRLAVQQEFARLVIVGSFAGECEALYPKLCAQKVVRVCPFLSPEGLCQHFKVTFCLDARKIDKCSIGQLLVLRAPLNDNLQPELVEFDGELMLSAVSFRYRKNECCKKSECRLSERCDLFEPAPVVSQN